MTIDLEGLKLYNKKFEEIKEGGFLKYISSHETLGVSGNSNDNIIRNYPNEDKIKAFILDFRFFIQNNNKSSLYNLNKTYKNLPINEMNKKLFVEFRKRINDHLDSYSNQIVGEKKLTYRDLMEAVIYGKYSHETQKDKYKEIAPDIINKEILNVRFIGLICYLLGLFDLIYQLNEEAINELNKSGGETNSD